jgi:hypothetical protein
MACTSGRWAGEALIRALAAIRQNLAV